MLFVSLLRSDQDWQYISSDKNVAGAIPSGHWVPRGKMFGGTPALNLMYDLIGSPETYNKWRDEYNCTDDWGWDNVLPYFKMSETETDPSFNSSIHGYNGPIKVSNYYDEYGSELIMKGINELGVKTVKDGSVPSGPGVMRAQGTLYKGRRWAVCKGYINPIQNRKNMYIAKCAVVVKILFDGNFKAIGVELNYKGNIYQVYARREVISCAGAIGTPILLQLSGIGRPDDLAAISVTLLLPNLPLDVEYYLWDHLAAWCWFKMDGDEDSLVEMVENVSEYYVDPTDSSFSGIGTLHIVAYLSVPISNGTAILECYFLLLKKKSLILPAVQGFIQYNPTVQKYLTDMNQDSMLLLVAASLLTPECHGYVRAKTTGAAAFDDIFQLLMQNGRF